MFFKRFLMLSSLALLSGGMACGLVEDALNDLAAQLEEEARSVGIDVNAQISDQETAEEVFGATVNSVLQKALEVAVESGTSDTGGPAPQQETREIVVNRSVEFAGGQLSVNGTMTQEQTADGMVLVTVDVTVDWNDIPVETQKGTFQTSGKVVQVTKVELDPQANGEPTSVESDLVGQIATDAGTFAFDVHISVSGNVLTVEGTLNGRNYSETIDLSQLGGGMDGAPDGATDTVTGPADGVTDAPSDTTTP